MAGRQQLHVLEQRAVGEDVLKGEVFEQRGLVELASEVRVREDRLLLGAEGERVAAAGLHTAA